MARQKARKSMVHRRRPPQWHLLLTGALLLVAVAGGIYLSGRIVIPGPLLVAADPVQQRPPVSAPQFAHRLHAETDSLLADLGISGHLIDARTDSTPVQILVGVPRDLPLTSVNLHLTRAIQALGGRVFEGLQSGTRRVELTCGFDSTVTTQYILRRLRTTTRRAGKIGLVVREVVTPTSAAEGMWAVPQQLTLLLADDSATRSTQLQSWARVANHELVGERPAAGADEAAHTRLRQHLDRDPTVLDVDPRLDAIQRELWALADRAADAGSAIGVLGDHPASRAALITLLPRLERRGYRFVAATTLLP